MKRVINPFLILLVFTLILAGCNNDDCDFTPPPATLTVTVTAYSLEDGSVLHTGQETITAPTDDGALAAQEKTYASPDVEGYLLAKNQTVQLPAVSPGQQMHISVSFFLPSVLSLVEKSKTKVISSTPVSTETDEVIDFTFLPGKSEGIEVPIKAYSRITNMEEVEKYIDGLFPQTRGEEEDEWAAETIKKVMVGPNNISTKKTKVIVEKGASGTVVNGKDVSGGSTITTTEKGYLGEEYSQPTVKEENKPDEGEWNLGTATPIEIGRKYITSNKVLRFEVVIEDKLYVVENIKVEVVRTEITITYLNTGSSGQIGDWKPVTGEGVVD